MKVRLEGKFPERIRPLLPKYGMEESDTPELIITHGGDGALLGAVRNRGGLPLLPLRSSEGTLELCPLHTPERRLKDFTEGKYSISELPLLSAEYRGKTLLAINDIFLHNLDRSSALRYRVSIDGEIYADEIIGDGVGMATVHGSTGYYKSITHSVFRAGIGLAFSNSTEEVSHLVLADESAVEVEVLRGPGLLVADNNPEQPVIGCGEKIVLRRSGMTARIYAIADFMCPACRMLRHPHQGLRPVTGLN